MLTIQQEVQALVALALPSALSSYCYFAVSITELSVMGHLGVDELAAVAYAQLCLDLSTLVFMQGFNGGMNSLCSQAFGAKNYRLVGEYTLLTSLLMTAACAPMTLLWWNLDTLLSTAGLAGQVASLAGQYGRLSLLWLWPRSMFQAVLQAQARPMPLAIGMVAGAWVVGVPAAYLMGVHASHPSLLGLWEGMLCGYTVTSIASFIPAFLRPNWQEEADKAVARSHLKEDEPSTAQESDCLLA
ncbi:hypothetical protein BBO99_00002570 [Phytophthora kernoviae]|uniref:Polysaccharide biosynthesis protein C-terminal domain-containing protein n=2 Tax=Phytophthora kernoviae TaxID=325452 RepID=A0A3R7JWZ7_9STRA|nr:hypothetical protein G195_004306 [Phytophthora kernoviae 00238/432]KAG2527319.1 hypothetical protein JM16_003511 [Phytophthora kernoviae]KAG2530335.1 hypothetical protein JM18_002223 [Phytophthora kernoviae]RLN20935.1 hypothetical protein BBI17_002469 [Phytophthora kernoviae]RLN82869.1 hypothetical protein BBO99_00002570 [Phytophthora kernoviae]